MSIGLAEGKKCQRRAADCQDLEKVAHFSRAGTGEAVDVGQDRLLRRLVAVAAEGGGAFADAEADEEVALVQHAVHMEARGDGGAGQTLEIDMARQVGLAGMGERRVEIVLQDGLQRIAETGDDVAVVDDDRRAAETGDARAGAVSKIVPFSTDL